MLLTVGRVVRPHGVRGEVVVEVRTDEPEQRYAVGAVLRAEPAEPAPPEPPRQTGPPEQTAPPEQPAPPGPGAAGPAPSTLTVAGVRPHQGRLIVAFQGVPDRTAAEALRGTWLRVESGEVPPPADPEEFRDHQLVGLAAVDPAGAPLGEISAVDHGPGTDRLVLRRPDGRTALVPFVGAMVPEVDLAGGRIVIDPPAGLLDL